ncbi:MAG: GNAT family N-acetyltransferase [Alphaproteobacteria bacterium]|nr:GNAT family N-acetyltransferase [Alphaproteobacteria bacterium]
MIRNACIDDAKTLQYIENTCFTGDKLSPRAIKYMLRNRQCNTYINVQDGEAAGYLMTLCHKRSKNARHYSLAVLPDYRNMGIAEALLCHAESHITSKSGFKLEIRADNAAALRLYQRMGYSIIRTIACYYDDNTDAYEMIKTL